MHMQYAPISAFPALNILESI